jgi:predicted CopG family antitoxin
MAVKTVTLTEDAYVALAGLKRDGESFSDVVRRLTRGSKSLLEFAGAWKDVPREKMKRFLDFIAKSDELSRQKSAREAKRSAR